MTKGIEGAGRTGDEEAAETPEAQPVPDDAAPDEAAPSESSADGPAEQPPDEAQPLATIEAAPVEPIQAPRGIEIYFLRHADAGDPAAWVGDDADRPLSGKGKRQSKRLGRLLRELPFQPDVIITSPKLRAAGTARIVGRAIGVKPAVDDRLASGFDQAALAELLGDLDGIARRVVLVGHDPDLSDLVSWLVGAEITLRKGALARTDLDGSTAAAGRASLRWLLPPDAVPS